MEKYLLVDGTPSPSQKRTSIAWEANDAVPPTEGDEKIGFYGMEDTDGLRAWDCTDHGGSRQNLLNNLECMSNVYCDYF